jgi:hypothetical protein
MNPDWKVGLLICIAGFTVERIARDLQGESTYRRLMVADRARALIIGLRYGLSLYLARYAASMRSLIGPSTGSNLTSFVMPAAMIWPAFCHTAAWYHVERCPL